MRRASIVALLAVFAGVTSTAQANVTVDFAATVTPGIDINYDPISTLDGFNAGDTVIGSFTYDPAATARVAVGPMAYYPLIGATLIDGVTTTTFDNTISGELGIYNDGTYYFVYVDGYTTDHNLQLIINLEGEPATGFVGNGTAIPSSISLSDFSASGSINDNSSGPSSGSHIQLNFAAADTVSAVPEPSSILAFATGLLGFALVRRRRT